MLLLVISQLKLWTVALRLHVSVRVRLRLNLHQQARLSNPVSVKSAAAGLMIISTVMMSEIVPLASEWSRLLVHAAVFLAL